MLATCDVNSFMSRLSEFEQFLSWAIGGLVWGAAVWFCFAQDYQALDTILFPASARWATGKLYDSITRKAATDKVRKLSGGRFAKMRGELLDSQRQQIGRRESRVGPRGLARFLTDLRHYPCRAVGVTGIFDEAEDLKLDRNEKFTRRVRRLSTEMTDFLTMRCGTAAPRRSCSILAGTDEIWNK